MASLLAAMMDILTSFRLHKVSDVSSVDCPAHEIPFSSLEAAAAVEAGHTKAVEVATFAEAGEECRGDLVLQEASVAIGQEQEGRREHQEGEGVAWTRTGSLMSLLD
jgi:hypothetical protein